MTDAKQYDPGRRSRALTLEGRTRDDLLIIAINACDALARIANHLTTDEGDIEETAEAHGLEAAEVVEMAHDGIIMDSRTTLDALIARFPK